MWGEHHVTVVEPVTGRLLKISSWSCKDELQNERRKGKAERSTRLTYTGLICEHEVSTYSAEAGEFSLYYESIKWEIQRRPINECRWDERLKTWKIWTSVSHGSTKKDRKTKEIPIIEGTIFKMWWERRHGRSPWMLGMLMWAVRVHGG
jgi:hypothetical protein